MSAPGKDSLVKYDTPALVMGKGKKPKLFVPKLDRKTALPATEDILNAILPPREWTSADGQLWVQHVSSTPATKIDVVNLQVWQQLGSQIRWATML
jgi:dynein light intermediate chain